MISIPHNSYGILALPSQILKENQKGVLRIILLRELY
jgi:hypothetical protein